MADQLTILGIAGSLRKASYNRGALRAAQQLCPEGAKIEVFELDGIPAFNQDEERKPPSESDRPEKPHPRGGRHSPGNT